MEHDYASTTVDSTLWQISWPTILRINQGLVQWIMMARIVQSFLNEGSRLWFNVSISRILDNIRL